MQGYSTAEIQATKDHVSLLPLLAMTLMRLGPVHFRFSWLAVTTWEVRTDSRTTIR